MKERDLELYLAKQRPCLKCFLACIFIPVHPTSRLACSIIRNHLSFLSYSLYPFRHYPPLILLPVSIEVSTKVLMEENINTQGLEDSAPTWCSSSDTRNLMNSH